MTVNPERRRSVAIIRFRLFQRSAKMPANWLKAMPGTAKQRGSSAIVIASTFQMKPRRIVTAIKSK
ncbi:hypothetical protein FHS17_005430 [Paenibacillus lupini]|nr:hypothetical protein [Paenibacillus lupini]